MNVSRLVTLLCVLSLYVAHADAQLPAAPFTAANSPSVAGWNELVDSLRDLPGRLLAKLPESMQHDPQVQQEVARLALEALTSSAFDALGGDGDHPAFMPNIGQLLNVGQPNADTVYRVARITPGGSYRLRGRRGSLRMAIMGQVGPMPGESGAPPAQSGATRSYQDINALHVDKEGRFDLLLSPGRPAGYTGDWWQLQPGTVRLLLRMVKADWHKEQDLTMTIERLDAPAARPRPTAADLEQRLRRLPAATNFMAALFINHVEQLRGQGYINKLKVFDTSQIGGLAGQFYYEGAYELRDDEALIVSAKVPRKCTYSSMILTNGIYETTDWYNNHSSLNDTQAKPDKDGVLRIVVASQDPGVANWLDTAGYPAGAIQGRWANCDSQPIPSVEKVQLADVRKSLPADTRTMTPEQRDVVIRERRRELQERPLW